MKCAEGTRDNSTITVSQVCTLQLFGPIRFRELQQLLWNFLACGESGVKAQDVITSGQDLCQTLPSLHFGKSV